MAYHVITEAEWELIQKAVVKAAIENDKIDPLPTDSGVFQQYKQVMKLFHELDSDCLTQSEKMKLAVRLADIDISSTASQDQINIIEMG
jgi:hypothetical protein